MLTALGNCPFRFLTTQVLLNRYPGSLRPQLPAADGKDEPVKDRPPRGGPRPITPIADSQEPESNLELVVYGIVSLYERYPLRPEKAAAEGN